MTDQILKVSRIGNSRGIRLPADALKRYQIGDSVIMEERVEGILLRPNRPAHARLSWEETARAMTAAGEDWSAWNATDADGLADIPRQQPPLPRVAEARDEYRTGARRSRR